MAAYKNDNRIRSRHVWLRFNKCNTVVIIGGNPKKEVLLGLVNFILVFHAGNLISNQWFAFIMRFYHFKTEVAT